METKNTFFIGVNARKTLLISEIVITLCLNNIFDWNVVEILKKKVGKSELIRRNL